MKKILFVAAVLTIGMVSCKKDDEAKPAAKTQTVMQGEKRDVGYWD